jgi:hypothetical protein
VIVVRERPAPNALAVKIPASLPSRPISSRRTMGSLAAVGSRSMASGSGGSMARPIAGSTSEMRLIHGSCIGESISPKPAAAPVEPDHPGVSVARLANGERPNRTVLTEYHGMGSTTGAFAIRNGRYKYVHYVKYPPQLFDLQSDPQEINDLAANPAYAGARSDCMAKLRAMLSPEDVDARAKRRQAEQLMRYGGRDAVIARGDLGFSPPPGLRPEFQ